MYYFLLFFQAKQLIHRHRGGSDGKLKYAYLEIYFYNKMFLQQDVGQNSSCWFSMISLFTPISHSVSIEAPLCKAQIAQFNLLHLQFISTKSFFHSTTLQGYCSSQQQPDNTVISSSIRDFETYIKRKEAVEFGGYQFHLTSTLLKKCFQTISFPRHIFPRAQVAANKNAQFLTPFSGTFIHALSYGEILFGI